MFLVIAISFNQPKFCPSAIWNATGITLANQSVIGTNAYGFYINTNNTVYVVDRDRYLIQVLFEGLNSPRTLNLTASSYPTSLFVTDTEDIYIGTNIGIEKRTLSSAGVISTLNTSGKCFDLFIDRNDSLYCSLPSIHQVIKRSLNSSDSQTNIIAGTGCSGFLPNMLNYPYGIFVHINFSLYVADSSNHRIQLFLPGQVNAITIAGYGAQGTITLHYPRDVTLDGNDNLFIVDGSNNRVVASLSTGFRCIVGCSGIGAPASDRLNGPWAMGFDSYGNICVLDQINHRIQKFLLASNSCGKYLFSPLP